MFRFMLALGDELCVCMLYFMSLIIFFSSAYLVQLFSSLVFEIDQMSALSTLGIISDATNR